MLRKRCSRFQKMQPPFLVHQPVWKLVMFWAFGIFCMAWCCRVGMMQVFVWQSTLASTSSKSPPATRIIKLTINRITPTKETVREMNKMPQISMITLMIKEEFHLISLWSILYRKWIGMQGPWVLRARTSQILTVYPIKIINQLLPTWVNCPVSPCKTP